MRREDLLPWHRIPTTRGYDPLGRSCKQARSNRRGHQGVVLIVGYTTGVFDLFHIGHLNILRAARGLCDRLIVGVTVDELVTYKGKQAVVPFSERIEIVRACRYVDTAVAQVDIDKVRAWERLKFDVLFVGDDWYDAPQWRDYENRLEAVGAKVRYLPYTTSTSSTQLAAALDLLVRGARST